jgi:hypothetical protein
MVVAVTFQSPGPTIGPRRRAHAQALPCEIEGSLSLSLNEAGQPAGGGV